MQQMVVTSALIIAILYTIVNTQMHEIYFLKMRTCKRIRHTSDRTLLCHIRLSHRNVRLRSFYVQNFCKPPFNLALKEGL